MRLRWALGSAAIVLLLANLTLLFSGAHRTRASLRKQESALSDSINQRAKRLSDLQTASDEMRQDVSEVMSTMDRILDLGRNPSGIDEAQSLWIGVASLFETARSASAGVGALTQSSIDEAEAGLFEYSKLRKLVDDSTEIRYLDALAEAFESMIHTQRAYSKMNETLAGGLAVYGDLITITEDFLNKQKSRFFRSNREAADWYSQRVQVSKVTGRIGEFKEQMRATALEAQASALATTEAFKEVEVWADRLRR